MDPRKFREAVFQIVYALEYVEGEDVMSLVSKQLKINKTHARGAYERALLISLKKEDLDKAIDLAVTEYEMGRIPVAELTILRIGAYELLYDDTIPGKVAISEAIRLTRKFATRDGARFINAALDAIYPEKSTA